MIAWRGRGRVETPEGAWEAAVVVLGLARRGQPTNRSGGRGLGTGTALQRVGNGGRELLLEPHKVLGKARVSLFPRPTLRPHYLTVA